MAGSGDDRVETTSSYDGRPDDLAAIVRMLADDPPALAVRPTRRRSRELPRCFDAIDRDPNHALLAAVIPVGLPAFAAHLIPYLTYRGGWRALIEGVRVDGAVRSAGIGRRLIEWAIERARDRGCHMVQLTSDKSRPDAIRFYEGLGFTASHEGLKLHLEPRVTSLADRS